MAKDRLPVDKILDYEGNMYELATAAIKEADWVESKGPEFVEQYTGGDKLVSAVLDKLLSGEVKYEYKRT